MYNMYSNFNNLDLDKDIFEAETHNNNYNGLMYPVWGIKLLYVISRISDNQFARIHYSV